MMTITLNINININMNIVSILKTTKADISKITKRMMTINLKRKKTLESEFKLSFGNKVVGSHKKLNLRLQKIYGIGKTLSKYICGYMGLSLNIDSKIVREITLSQVHSLFELQNLNLGDNLLRLTKTNISHLKLIESYRGNRHLLSLPVRGQRTHTNRKTSRKLLKSLQK